MEHNTCDRCARPLEDSAYCGECPGPKLEAAEAMYQALRNIQDHVEYEAKSPMAGPWWRNRAAEIRAVVAAWDEATQ